MNSINDKSLSNQNPKSEIENLMKRKFNQWKLDEIILEDFDGSEYYLTSYYKCRKILGVGGFAYVLEAFDE